MIDPIQLDHRVDLIALFCVHRHRYEVNPEYVSRFEAAGMKFVGQDEKNVRMEVRTLYRVTHQVAYNLPLTLI